MKFGLRALLHNQFVNVRTTFAVFVTAFFVFASLVCAQDGGSESDAIAIFNQGQDLHEKGDLTGAIRLYNRALTIIPEFPEAVYQRGLAEFALGKVAEAEKSLRKAVELRPDWSLAVSSLGSLLLSQKKYVEAERVLNKAIELDDQNFPAFISLTELHLKTGASRAILKDLLAKMLVITAKANPPTSAWIARAALQDALGLAKEARSSINKALSIEPANKLALVRSAEIALSSGDVQRADWDLKQLEAIAPNDVELSGLLRAKIYLNEGNIKDALAILNRLGHSQDAADLRKLIETNESLSAEELEKRLETDPKNAGLLGRLCKHYRKEDPLKALDYCRRAADYEPDNLNHAIGYGAALVQAKQYEPAVVLLRKIAAVAPDNSTVRANLGAALFQLKLFVEAKKEFEWLINSQPKSAGLYLFLAISHDRLREYLDAFANYQQYLKLADPVENKLDIEKVNLRLSELQKLIKKK